MALGTVPPGDTVWSVALGIGPPGTLSRLYLRVAVLFVTIHQCQTREQSSPAACFLGPELCSPVSGPARTERKSRHPAGHEESTPFLSFLSACLVRQHHSWSGPDISAGVTPGSRMGQNVPGFSSLNTSGTPLHPSHPLSCLLLSCREISQRDPYSMAASSIPSPDSSTKCQV